MTIPSVAYANEFQAKLADAVSQALELDNPMIGGLKAFALYSADLQLAATMAAHSLEIPQELAIAYLISAEAIRFDQGNSKLSLAFSSDKRRTFETHRKLMEFAGPFVRMIPDKTLFNTFLGVMLQNLKGGRQKAGT